MADLGVTPFQEPPICFSISGWWFGFLLCFHILGILIPTDFYIFQTGWDPQICLGWDMSRRAKSKKKHWMIDLSDLQVTSTINRFTYIYIYQIYIYIDRYIYILYIHIIYFYIYIQDQHRIFPSFQHLSINSSTSPRFRSIPGQGEASKRPLGGREVSCDVQISMGKPWEIHGKSVGKVKDQWENHGKLG